MVHITVTVGCRILHRMGDYTSSSNSLRGLLARLDAGRRRWRLRLNKTTERTAFKDLFELAPIPIVMLHGSELILDLANEAALALAGGRDVLGKPLLEVLPELQGQGCDEDLREVMSSGVPHVREEALIRLGRAGTDASEPAYWTYSCARLQYPHGEDMKVIVVLADATAQVLARQRLEALAAEAEAGSRAKDQFVAMLSHELRNPLSPIVTALELLRLHGLDTHEQALIERQVRRLVRLVDDLLDVSRIARGKLTLQKQPIEIAKVVAAAVEMVGPLLEDRRHRLSIDVPPGLGVDVDPDRMSQVVSNLLTNAARYSERRSKIWIAAAKAGDRVRLSVKDQGIGIDSEKLEGIFDTFTRHEQSSERARGGLGLGLTIVRHFVRVHGGEVRAYSDGTGKGSEFVILLPRVELAEEAGEEAVAVESRGKRILVVDDNHDAAETLAAALTVTGYDVRIAHYGPSALSTAREFAPETALIDIGLPVMDGYELGRRLREQRAAIRLIAVTGYGQAGDLERSTATGFEAHLIKPVSLKDVQAVLEGAAPGAQSGIQHTSPGA